MFRSLTELWLHMLFYFVYGEIFFITGLAVGLQLRHRSALELARPMPWLAAFGILHAFSEWGHVFIPIQERLFPAFQAAFYLLHTSLLALSFFCLSQFGFCLVKPREGRGFCPMPVVVLGIWGLVLLLIVREFQRESLFASTENMTRCVLGVPALWATFAGLLRQSSSIRRRGFAWIARDLQFAALAYGLGGAVELFSISPVYFRETFHLPLFVRPALGLAQAIFIVRSLALFTEETERQLQEMRQAYLLNQERERIARELHDGVIQNLYGASLYLESLASNPCAGAPEFSRTVREIRKILENSIADLRNYIYDLDLLKDGLFLEDEIRRLLLRPEFQSIPPIEIRTWGKRYPLRAAQLFHLIQFVREALANVVRHAEASKVEMEVNYRPEGLELKIRDDGRGMILDGSVWKRGRGLANMRYRAKALGGRMEIESSPGRGTTVTLRISNERESG